MREVTNVYLCTDSEPVGLSPYGPSIFNKIMRAAEAAKDPSIRLSAKPETADLIIVIEPRDYFQTNLLRSDFYQTYRQKLIVFSQQDHCIPRIPGIYTRIPHALHNVGIYEYGFYSKVFEFNALDTVTEKAERSYLFSFVGNGAACPRVRQRVLELEHPQCLLVDSRVAFGDTSGNYAKSIEKSEFVLAPRGLGPSSFRLFEAMRAGRAPVIISDEWRPIAGIDWDSFSVRIAEADISHIPEILMSRVDDAVQMGSLARSAYRNYFAEESSFSWLIGTAQRLLRCRSEYAGYIERSLLYEGIKYGLMKSTTTELVRNLFQTRRDFSPTLTS